MPTPQQKTARKNIAEVGLREELAKRKGGFKELDDVKEFLQVFAVESELSKDYFQILDDKDYADMYIKAMNTISLSVNAGSRPSTGATTPPESSASSPEDYHEPRRLSYEDPVSHCGIAKSNSIQAPADECVCLQDECFDVKFQHPSKNLLEMVTANRCKEGDSFISDRILARDNLSIHLDADNAIRLTWKTFSEGSVKTYRTRFRKIPDADIANDIAIGQNAYSDDEVDHKVSEPMNQLSLGVGFS